MQVLSVAVLVVALALGARVVVGGLHRLERSRWGWVVVAVSMTTTTYGFLGPLLVLLVATTPRFG